MGRTLSLDLESMSACLCMAIFIKRRTRSSPLNMKEGGGEDLDVGVCKRRVIRFPLR